MMEIGSWGDVNLVNTGLVLTSGTPKMPSDVASHRYALWAGGPAYLDLQKSQQDILTKRNRLPRPPHVRHYVCFWTALSGIEMTGTGGPFKREAPAETSVMGLDGENNLIGTMLLFQAVDLLQSYLSIVAVSPMNGKAVIA